MKLFIFLLGISIIYAQAMELLKTRSKYHAFLNNAGKLPLNNNNFFHYYGNFQFGTPAANTTFITDISSAQLWISSNEQCYQPSQSSTSNITQTPGVIQYGQSLVAGYMGTEMLSITSLGLTNLNIVTLFVDTQKDMGQQIACGLMGLSNDISWKNFIEIAVKNGQLDDSKFAFQLNDTDQKNFLYLGSASFPAGTLTWLNVIRSTYWSIAIDSTLVGHQAFPQPAGMKEGILDTGSSLILMSTDAMNGLLQNDDIKAKCQSQSSYYLCPCQETYPIVSFTNGNQIPLQVSYTNYMMPLGGQFCMLGFAGIDPSELPFIILGDSFLKGYFFAFDKTNQKIGLNL